MISGLHHYALEVPGLAVAEGFLQDFGLETGEKDGSLVAHCPGRDQQQVRLVEAPVKRLHHVSFTLRPGTVDTVRETLERAGTPLIEPAPGATEDGLWNRDADGTAVQLLDTEPAPPRPVAEALVNMGASRQRLNVAQWTEATKDVLPRRLGRSLLFTAQPGPMTDFYTRVPGLRPSDTIHDDRVTFLNAGPGDHHIFGFIASTHRGFHHASFEVPSIDAIAIGAEPMNFQVAAIDDVFRNWHFRQDHDAEIEMGPGRHPQSTAIFLYFLGPEGFTHEYSFGVRRIEDEAAWVPRTFDPAEPGAIDMWLGPASRPVTQPQIRVGDGEPQVRTGGPAQTAGVA